MSCCVTTASPRIAVLRAGTAHFGRKPVWASTQRWGEVKGKQTFPENICFLHMNSIRRGKFTIKVEGAIKSQMTHGNTAKFHLFPFRTVLFFPALSYGSSKRANPQ